MSLSITYTTTYASWTVSDYLADWAGYFGDANHRIGEVEDGVNTGGFYPGSLDGTQYSLTSPNSDAGFIAEGDLTYTLFNSPAHTLWGELDSVSLGTDLVETGSGFDFAPGGWEVTFSGLGLSTDVADLTTTNQGIVHEVIYGLMSGDATALEGVLNGLLDDYGVSTADTFDVVAAALAAGPLGVESAETVGVQAYADDLALAA
ncbi:MULTISPECIES: heme acquisition protein HasA [Pseudomonas]|uniref:heme acquisition protein HasA n=1 Tax=Pseudomonas TaxID=286 RepID=UPI00257F8978|nr:MULTISPECIES: heme acquisition protein HasA [Pseudomonas]